MKHSDQFAADLDVTQNQVKVGSTLFAPESSGNFSKSGAGGITGLLNKIDAIPSQDEDPLA